MTARTSRNLPLNIGVGPVRATSGAINIRINNGVSTTASIVAAVLLKNGTTLYGKQENVTANTSTCAMAARWLRLPTRMCRASVRSCN